MLWLQGSPTGAMVSDSCRSTTSRGARSPSCWRRNSAGDGDDDDGGRAEAGRVTHAIEETGDTGEPAVRAGHHDPIRHRIRGPRMRSIGDRPRGGMDVPLALRVFGK